MFSVLLHGDKLEVWPKILKVIKFESSEKGLFTSKAIFLCLPKNRHLRRNGPVDKGLDILMYLRLVGSYPKFEGDCGLYIYGSDLEEKRNEPRIESYESDSVRVNLLISDQRELKIEVVFLWFLEIAEVTG